MERDASTPGVASQRETKSSVAERTGRTWAQWFEILDRWHATDHSHTEIAGWLVDEHATGNWWAQTIAVAYEQERGMRAPGQGADGRYAVSASKTVEVNVDRLFWAFTDPAARHSWLPGARLHITSASPPRSLRAAWEDGSTRLAVGFTVKGPSKSQVALTHERLPDAAAAAESKDYWRERLNALKRLLEG